MIVWKIETAADAGDYYDYLSSPGRTFNVGAVDFTSACRVAAKHLKSKEVLRSVMPVLQVTDEP